MKDNNSQKTTVSPAWRQHDSASGWRERMFFFSLAGVELWGAEKTHTPHHQKRAGKSSLILLIFYV